MEIVAGLASRQKSLRINCGDPVAIAYRLTTMAFARLTLGKYKLNDGIKFWTDETVSNLYGDRCDN